MSEMISGAIRRFGLSGWKRRIYSSKQKTGDVKKHSSKLVFTAEKLKHRSLISVKGPHAGQFLQELITNDIKKFEWGMKSLYCLFLNPTGRIVHDSIVYKHKDGYYIECDWDTQATLVTHMKMYKSSFEADIYQLDSQIGIWAIFNPESDINAGELGQEKKLPNNLSLGEHVIICRDPRLKELGYRVIAPNHENIVEELRSQGIYLTESEGDSQYRQLRYKLGVGEGSDEIPQGRCLALETNADYLNGVSLEKPNFVGRDIMIFSEPQMRFLPLVLDAEPKNKFPKNSPLIDVLGRKKNPMGYLMALAGNIGLGLIKISSQLKNTVKLGPLAAHYTRPFWWPRSRE